MRAVALQQRARRAGVLAESGALSMRQRFVKSFVSARQPPNGCGRHGHGHGWAAEGLLVVNFWKSPRAAPPPARRLDLALKVAEREEARLGARHPHEREAVGGVDAVPRREGVGVDVLLAADQVNDRLPPGASARPPPSSCGRPPPSASRRPPLFTGAKMNGTAQLAATARGRSPLVMSSAFVVPLKDAEGERPLELSNVAGSGSRRSSARVEHSPRHGVIIGRTSLIGRCALNCSPISVALRPAASIAPRRAARHADDRRLRVGEPGGLERLSAPACDEKQRNPDERRISGDLGSARRVSEKSASIFGGDNLLDAPRGRAL